MVNCPHDVAVGELLRLADPLSKTVLGAYRQQCDHSVNLTAIASSKFKTEVLERCAEYLNLSTRTATGDKIYKNKSQIADKIILKIESYFENTCDECNQAYQHHITDEEMPKIACLLCLQGAHNCDQMNRKLEPLLALADHFPKGMVWICRGCREKNETRPQMCITVAPDNSNKAGRDTGNQKNDDKHKDDKNGDDNPFQSPRRDRHMTGRTHELDICPLYKKAQCPHGITGKKIIEGKACLKAHPKRCIQYCRYGTNKKGGCTKGLSCSYYHPILCRNALVNKRCTREGCTFTHLKGTVRHMENDPNRNNSHHDTNETRKRLQYDQATNGLASRDSNSKGETTTNMDNPAQQPEILNASFLEKMINDLMDKKMRQMESHFMPYMRQMSMQCPPLMPMTQMPLLNRVNMFPQQPS